MADDIDLTKDHVFIPKPEDVTEVTFVGADGRVKTHRRGKGGRFQRKPRPMPSGTEIKRIGRESLLELEADPDTGKITKESKVKAQNIIDNMYAIATNTEWKNDAKFAMAAKQAADWLWLNFVGKPSATDEDKEDAKDKVNSGVKIVVIQPPELMHPEVQEYREPSPPTTPVFLLEEGKKEE